MRRNVVDSIAVAPHNATATWYIIESGILGFGVPIHISH